MKLIIGLGNPGVRYHFSRHNAGFLVLDRLAEHYNIAISQKGFDAYFGKGKIDSIPVFLAKPQTFMNLSGVSVKKLFEYFKLMNMEDVIVVHDELDLPFNTLRLKAGGGHGGHKGLVSIITDLGSDAFIRVRIGVGKPVCKTMVEGYLLESFSEEEMKIMPFITKTASEAIVEIVSSGIQAAMNMFNCKTINNFNEEVK